MYKILVFAVEGDILSLLRLFSMHTSLKNSLELTEVSALLIKRAKHEGTMENCFPTTDRSIFILKKQTF